MKSKLVVLVPLMSTTLLAFATGCPGSDGGVGNNDTDTTHDTDTEGVATDTEGPGETDTEGETDTDGEQPPECEPSSGEDQMHVALDIADFPVPDADDYALEDLPCVVAEIGAPDAQGVVTTQLSCADEMAVEHSLTLELTPPDDLDVPWAVDDSVHLSADWLGTVDSIVIDDLSVSLRTPPGLLLVAAGDHEMGSPSVLAPIAVEIDHNYCTDELWDMAAPARVTYTLQGGVLSLVGDGLGMLSDGDSIVYVQQGPAEAGQFGETTLLFRFVALATPL